MSKQLEFDFPHPPWVEEATRPKTWGRSETYDVVSDKWMMYPDYLNLRMKRDREPLRMFMIRCSQCGFAASGVVTQEEADNINALNLPLYCNRCVEITLYGYYMLGLKCQPMWSDWIRHWSQVQDNGWFGKNLIPKREKIRDGYEQVCEKFKIKSRRP